MEFVRCELKYSRAGATFVALAAVASAAIAAAMPWSVPLRFALGAYIAACALQALATMRRAIRVSVALDGLVRMELRDSSSLEGALRPGGFVAPWLVCVRWRARGARFDRATLVLPDMLSADDFRRLRIVLRAA
jgi:hypothetical protein